MVGQDTYFFFITRDIEVKNNLTIAGEGGGDSGKRGLQELL